MKNICHENWNANKKCLWVACQASSFRPICFCLTSSIIFIKWYWKPSNLNAHLLGIRVKWPSIFIPQVSLNQYYSLLKYRYHFAFPSSISGSSVRPIHFHLLPVPDFSEPMGTSRPSPLGCTRTVRLWSRGPAVRRRGPAASDCDSKIYCCRPTETRLKLSAIEDSQIRRC